MKQRRMEQFYVNSNKNKKCRSKDGVCLLTPLTWPSLLPCHFIRNFIRDHSMNQHGQAQLCGSPSALRLLGPSSLVGIPFLREKKKRVPAGFGTPLAENFYLFAYYKFNPLGVSFLNTYSPVLCNCTKMAF